MIYLKSKIRVKIKKVLIKIIYNLNYKLFMKNIILFESNPDYSDNSYYVFNECLNRGINKKCKLVWLCFHYDKSKNYPKYKNVKFVNRKNKFIMLYYCLFSKYIIDCNIYVHKFNKNQFRIHLTHGVPVKLVYDYLIDTDCTDYYIVESEYWKKIINNILKKYNIIRNIYVSGLPRNDTFFNIKKEYVFFQKIKRNKTILWLPTYRNHKSHITTDSDMYNMKEIVFLVLIVLIKLK